MFERFTEPARRVVVLAQEESRALQHDHIGTSHLLLGLVREEGVPGTRRLLARHGVTYEALLERVVLAAGRGERPPSGHIPFSANARLVLEQAAYASEELGQDHVDQPHLLLGLLRVRESHARALLAALSTDPDAVTVDAVRAARTSQPEAPAGVADPFADLLAEYRALAAALGRFGRHAAGCPGGDGCVCGLAEALTRAVGVLGDEPPATCG